MPRLTRYLIKTAFVYLAVALVLGLLLTARAAFDLPAEIAAFSPVFFHVLMVGWVTQLIFGMLFWMLPKYSKEQPRGSERLAWAAYLLLNVGLILRIVGEPLIVLQPEWGSGWLVLTSAILQLLGGWVFIVCFWPRVKER